MIFLINKYMLKEIIQWVMLNSIFKYIEWRQMKKYKLTRKEKQFLLWIVRKKNWVNVIWLLRTEFTAHNFKDIWLSEQFYIETRKRLKYVKVINEKMTSYKALRVKIFKWKKGIITFNTIKLFAKWTL